MPKQKLENCDDSPVYSAAELFCDSEMDFDTIEKSVRDILVAIGEDPEREGLLNTPHRVAKAYAELLEGYRTDPIKLVNGATFKANYDEIVIVRDIEFNSLCEHHMLPFLGRAHVAFLPKGEVIGLSKLPRIVDMFSRRLQIQEKMTRQIADFLNTLLQPRGVAVIVEAVHMCSMIRGVEKHDARMTTSCMLGAFRNNQATRMEFLDNISRGAKPLEF
ncbi:MAG: GTP cyclohydrolase I FolE [Chloroflexi bacterium]|nr:GTP cyclohydrolase I FolE [Chloroflexota bacterium]